MKINKKIFTVIVGVFSVFGVAAVVQASPLQFTSPASTSSATTTLSYLRPGLATTTLIYDTYQSAGSNQTNNGNTYFDRTIPLVVQYTASSTATVFNTKIEFSQDGVDWYEDNYQSVASGTTNIVTPNSYTYTYASTTLGGGAVLATSQTNGKVMRIVVPTRFVRAVFTNTGANGAIWAQFVPSKEILSR